MFKSIVMPTCIVILTNVALGCPENTGNPLSFWVPVGSLIITAVMAIVNLLLYLNNKKTLSILYSKPIPEIAKINTGPTTKDECGGFASICSMKIRIYNPSSLSTQVKISFRQKKKILKIIDKEFQAETPTGESDYYVVPQFGNNFIDINLHYGEAKKYINQTLTLLVVDMRKNESTLDFIFKNEPAYFKA